jgi:hypothetical protein
LPELLAHNRPGSPPAAARSFGGVIPRGRGAW